MAKYEKGELIDFLIENSDQFSEEDRKSLEVFNADQLEVIAENAALQIENGKGKSCDTEDDDEEEEDMAKNETLTPDELFSKLPAEHQAILNEALEMRQTRRTEVVKAIVANKSNTIPESVLNGMDMKTLEGIAALAGVGQKQKSIANYFGSQGSVSVDNSDDSLEEEGLVMPTLNFEQMSQEKDKKGVA
jgi:hypothetical protein